MSAQPDEDRPPLLPRRPGWVGLARPSLTRVLLRRADAQPREEWQGSEEWRGLSDLGRRQAEDLVGRLAGLSVHRVLSSPSLRCRQTVVPLALSLGVEVEVCPELAHGAGLGRLRPLLLEAATDGAVFCTHREVLQTLFAELSGGSVPARVAPAASWTLLTGRDVALAPLG
jgi:broad specificity phosphatase PhoE